MAFFAYRVLVCFVISSTIIHSYKTDVLTHPTPCPLPRPLPLISTGARTHTPMITAVLGCPCVHTSIHQLLTLTYPTNMDMLQGPDLPSTHYPHTVLILPTLFHPTPFTCRASARPSMSSSSTSKLHAPAVNLSSYWLNSGCGP